MSLKHTPDIHYRNLLKVKLNKTESVIVNGRVTGRSYIFKRRGDLNWVDKRDIDDFEKNMSFTILS